MDLTNGSRTLAGSQEWVCLSSLAGPAEPTPPAWCFSFFFFLVHESRHFCELFKILVPTIRYYWVWAVTFLGFHNIRPIMHGLTGFSIANLFDGELDPANF